MGGCYRVLAASLVVWLLAAPISRAGAQEYELDIPAASVDMALKSLSLQTGYSVIFQSKEIALVQTSTVAGRYTVEMALDLLLETTNLSYGLTEGDVITITRAATEQSIVGASTVSQYHNQKAPFFKKLVAAVMAAFTVTAVAQTEGDEERVMEEIIVTALKREQTLQEVPMAVTALTGEMLVRMSADDFIDFARSVPGMAFVDLGPGRNNISIRGVSVTGGLPSVGFYIDETPIPPNRGTIRNVNVDPKMLDINRVEVLKGPQGTLYGQSSMGGTVRIIPNRPDSTRFEASVAGTVQTTKGGGQGYHIDLMMNVPLIEDKLALRGVFYQRFEDGFIDRRYFDFDGPNTLAVPSFDFIPNRLTKTKPRVNTEDTTGARLIMDWYPRENIRITPNVFWESMKTDGFQDITLGDTNPDEELVQEHFFNVAEPFRQEWALFNVTVDADFGNVNFVSSTSYFDREFIITEEADAVIVAFLGGAPYTDPLAVGVPLEEGTWDEDFTQELRLSSIEPVWGRLDWILGVFYNDNNGERSVNWEIPGLEEALGNPPGSIPGGDLFTLESNFNFRSKAIFGEMGFHIIPNDLIFTAGIRFYDIESDTRADITGLFNGGRAEVTSASASDGEQLRFNLAWRASDAHNLYIQVAQGFRPGFGLTGFFPPTCDEELIERGIDPANPPRDVGPDGVWNYEIGAKSLFRDGRVSVNTAVYQIDWTDIQQTIFMPSCGFRFTANAGKAQSKGFEVEVTADVSDHWLLTGGVGYTDATLSEGNPAINAEKGERIQNVPKWTANASAQYSFAIQNTMIGSYDAYLRADIQYVGSSYSGFFQNEGDPFQKKPPLTLVNLRFGVSRGGWEGALYVRNLFDQVERIAETESLVITVPGRPRWVVNYPRQIGFTIKKYF